SSRPRLSAEARDPGPQRAGQVDLATSSGISPPPLATSLIVASAAAGEWRPVTPPKRDSREGIASAGPRYAATREPAPLRHASPPAVRSCRGTTPSGVAAREQRLQMLHVVQVLVPARGALVLQEIAETDHGQGYARPVGSLQALVHPVQPGLFERDAIDCADQVDSMRRSAELDDHLRLQ